jgi:hypothetical protein
METFRALVDREAVIDKKEKESQSQSGISVRWDMSIKKKMGCDIFLPIDRRLWN